MQELADRFGKSVESLVIVGDDVLVNKDSYYTFSKSLIHLFRNIIDHGIETPEERVEIGKPETGRVECEISQHENNKIRIIIRDDGRGIDFDQVRKKAVEKGMHSEKEIFDIPEERLLELVFSTGFSTKESVSSLSGRGIGLASVKDELERLGGEIRVKTEWGKGTEFDMQIPHVEL